MFIINVTVCSYVLFQRSQFSPLQNIKIKSLNKSQSNKVLTKNVTL